MDNQKENHFESNFVDVINKTRHISTKLTDHSKYPTGGLKPVENVPSIRECFDGTCIFVTGSSGFIGKVLIEKLLRSCPGIQRIYVILRSKKHVQSNERLQNIINVPLFDSIRKTEPALLDKITAISGDLTEPRLGLSAKDEDLLVSTVSVIFHIAANVRFDDPLQHALFINVRATREISELAKKMKRLKVFVHVSTMYCNTDQSVIDEIVYPPKADWRQLLKMAETMPKERIELLSSKIIYPMPNTYTFTKALAEDIINEYSNSLPILIFRPSIVISSTREPIKGWVDNFNGLTGITAGIHSGVIRILFGCSEVTADYLPVDMAIKSLIASTWYRIVQSENYDKKCLVINASTSNVKPISYSSAVSQALAKAEKIPFQRVMWYPFTVLTSWRPLYFFGMIFLHILPGLILDGILTFTGNKFSLLQIYRKIYMANEALGYFIINEWTFKNSNFLSLDNILLPCDYETFKINLKNENILEVVEDVLMGIKLYLLKEDQNVETNLKHSRKLRRRMKILHYTICTVLWFLFVWICFLKGGIILTKMYGILDYFISPRLKTLFF